MPLTLEQLHIAAPRAPASALAALNAFLELANANTPQRSAAATATVAFECDQFNSLTEPVSGDAYEGRKDLGNTVPGDGPLFKGRGGVQLTGRANYTAAALALAIPLVEHPELAADPNVWPQVSAHFWTSHNLNELADAGDFVGIVRVVNGGTNDLGIREAFWARAKRALGA